MKKIISLVAALAMAATTFVSFATVTSAATSVADYAVSAEKVSADTYNTLTGRTLSEGTAYYVKVDISDITGTGLYTEDGEVGLSFAEEVSKSAIVSTNFSLSGLTGVSSRQVTEASAFTNPNTKLNKTEGTVTIQVAPTNVGDYYPEDEDSEITAIDDYISFCVVFTEEPQTFTANYTLKIGYNSYKFDDGLGDYQVYPLGAYNTYDEVSGTLVFEGVEEEDPEVPATAIAINGDDVVVADAGATGTLTATVTPNTTTDTIAWATNDECVTIDAATGAWTAVKPGKATITVTAGSVSDTVVIKVKPSTLVGSKFEYMNGIVWAGNSITGAAFGKNFKATFTDGVNTVTQSISGDALETEGTMTFDAVLKVYNDVADAGITMQLSCDAAE